MALLHSVWVNLGRFSDFREHTGKNLEAEVLLVTEPVGTPLDDPDLVVDALHEPQGDFVLLVAVGPDAVPVVLEHAGEFLERLQPLPPEGVAPVVEEASGPPGALVVPQLVKRLLEEVGLIEPPVGLEQQAQRLLPFEGEVLPVRQQRVLLSLDEAPVLSREAGVLPPVPPVPYTPHISGEGERVVLSGGVGGGL